MTVRKKKKVDEHVRRILQVLRREYGSKHPSAKIEAYRYNSASIRIRIIDDEFKGRDLVQREEMVWPILQNLPEETLSEVTVLLLIPPSERKRSMMSVEFDERTSSPL